MMSMFFMFMVISLQMLFYISHPIFFSVMLISMSLFISILLMKINISWFFFLLMLVFLGGVMVLVIYMNTLSMNEKFFMKNFSFMDLSYFSFLFLILMFLKKNTMMKINYSNFIPAMLYENMNFYVMIFLMVYLLLTMICVVKLIKFEYGPLIKRL